MDYILKFVSPAGEILMGDGRHDFFRLNSVLGLGLPELERQTVIFSGRRGEKTVSSRFLPRIITVGGDIIEKNALGRIIRVLSDKGTLYVKSRGEERQIDVRAIAMEEAEKIGDITRVVFQFVADDPAFTAYYDEKKGIYSRTDLIKGSFTPPCVFTERISGGCVVNSGDLDVEPVIYVICEETSGKVSQITITHNDNGAKIKLSHKFSAGETLIIDIGNAEITDADGKSLLSSVSDDTYLSEFILKKGENNISIQSDDAKCRLKIYCVYKNRFLEAIL